jgi:YidC/Oxa1 family membrane protein insertase
MNEDSKRPLLTLAIFGLLFGVGILVLRLVDDPKPAEPPADEPAAVAEDAPAVPPQADLEAADSLVLETPEFRAEWTSVGGGLRSLRLQKDRFAIEGEKAELVTTSLPSYLPFRQHLEGTRVPATPRYAVEPKSATEGILRLREDGLSISRKLEAREGYRIVSTTRIVNVGDEPRTVTLVDESHHYVARAQEESAGFLARPSPKLSHGFCFTDDGNERKDRDKLLGGFSMGPAVRFAALEDTYFAMAMAPTGDDLGQVCALEAENRGGTLDAPDGTLYRARVVRGAITLAPGEAALVRTLLYAGPKQFGALSAAGHGLDEVVDVGWFGFIGRGLIRLLSFIYGYVGEWGIAIILLTLIVKIVLYPLTEKSFQSMARMRLLKPEMDRINELYRDDREKKGAAIMELYKKHGVNPVAGCLPSLLQMPVWFALYQSLSTNVELYHASGLWFADLSAPDPGILGVSLIKPLPLLLGGLMIVQQRLSPAAMDPVQAKIMMVMMPGMITVFMYFLPAGLCVYMVTNSVLGIAQQQSIQMRLERASARSDGDAGGDDTGETDETPAASDKPRPGKAGRKISRSSRRNRGGRS